MDNSSNNDSQQRQHRTCQLAKSPRLPSGQAEYFVTADGIRGVVPQIIVFWQRRRPFALEATAYVIGMY
jgi:hypothetical protein